MAYNKDNYENQRLTPKQEKFVEEILKGKTQYEAYINAYPRAKNWQRQAVDVNASQLMNDTKIKLRLEEYGYKQEKKILWTRQKALETINYVMDMNKKDMERIDRAYEDEIQLLNAQIMELSQQMTQETDPRKIYNIAKGMQELTAEIALRNKQRRTNSTNARGIYEGAKILNRMFGYDITKVEISNEDSERDEMEKLTAEELRSILANVNKENTECQ